MYDVIVIGSGPAGLSAAINVRQRGRSVAVVGLSQESSSLYKAERIDNYLGMPGMSGADMLGAFRKHAEDMGAVFVKERVLSTFSYDGKWMISAGSEVIEGLTVVFAGGVSRGKTYPGEDELLGKGVSYCATCDGMFYRGRQVAVIGFSDADREEAEYLTGIGCSVKYYQKPGKVEILGKGQVSSVRVDSEESEVSAVFVLRPSLAPTVLFPGLELDGSYIKVDRQMATNIPGLFAAGDCTGTPLQISKAVGEGLIAGQKAANLAAQMIKEKESAQ